MQVVSVVLLLALALALRVYRLQDESITRDELACAAYLHHPTLGEYMVKRAHDDPAIVMPLYFVSQYYWGRLVGLSPIPLRILPLAFSMATLVVLYLFGRRLLGHTAGIVALMCATFSKLLIFESQELRMYAFTFFFALASVYALYRALNDAQRHWWVLNVLFTACLVWTHILALPLLVVEGLFLIASRPREIGLQIRWGIAVSIPVLAMPIYVLTATEAPSDEMGWMPLPWRARFISTFLYTFTGSKMDHFDELAHAVGNQWGAVLLTVFFTVAGLWLVVRMLLAPPAGLGPQETLRRRQTFALLTFWLVIPASVLYVTSYVYRPCYIERYAYHSAFAAYLGLGCAIALLPSRYLRVASIAVLAGIYALLATDLVRPLRPNFASGIAYINENATAGDVFAATDVNSRIPTNYYLQQGATPVLSPDEFTDYVVKNATEGNRVWAVFYAEYPINPKEFEERLRANGIVSDVRIFPGWQDLRVYKLTREAPKTAAG
jgi:uncharacterized membrane protein